MPRFLSESGKAPSNEFNARFLLITEAFDQCEVKFEGKGERERKGEGEGAVL